jgi:hypothetical protein
MVPIPVPTLALPHFDPIDISVLGFLDGMRKPMVLVAHVDIAMIGRLLGGGSLPFLPRRGFIPGGPNGRKYDWIGRARTGDGDSGRQQEQA